jgi:hypothetical protein
MKKIEKIEVKKIPDYDSDLSYLGTFSVTPGEFPVKHDRSGCLPDYFNAENVENMKQARQNYKRICKYCSDEIMDYGVIAEAEILTQPAGANYWKIDKITSGGLWGMPSDSGDEYFKEEANNQLAELQETLKEFGFSDKEINGAAQNAVIFNE